MHIERKQHGRVRISDSTLGVEIEIHRTATGIELTYNHDGRAEVISEARMAPDGAAPVKMFAGTVQVHATAVQLAADDLAAAETVDARLHMLRTRGSVPTVACAAGHVVRVAGRHVLVADDGPRAGLWLAAGDEDRVRAFAARNGVELAAEEAAV